MNKIHALLCLTYIMSFSKTNAQKLFLQKNSDNSLTVKFSCPPTKKLLSEMTFTIVGDKGSVISATKGAYDIIPQFGNGTSRAIFGNTPNVEVNWDITHIEDILQLKIAGNGSFSIKYYIEFGDGSYFQEGGLDYKNNSQVEKPVSNNTDKKDFFEKILEEKTKENENREKYQIPKSGIDVLENSTKQEVFTLNNIPPLVQAQPNAQVPLNMGPSNWVHLGPYNPTLSNKGLGRVKNVVFHPTDPSITYAVSEYGGIWKKTGTGAWINLTDGWEALGATELTISPSNPNIMYASLRQVAEREPYSSFIMKSTDGGTNWAKIEVSTNLFQTHSIIVHPTNPDIVLVNSITGIHRTSDGGINWTKVQTYNGNNANFTYGNIVFKPNNGSIVYASMVDLVYKSTDAGQTWSILTSVPSASIRYSHLAVTPANPELLFIAQAAQFAFSGLYKSSDGGATFTQIANPNSSVKGPCISGSIALSTQLVSGGYLRIGVSPTDADKMTIGAIFACRSTDGGVTWNAIQYCGSPTTPYVDTHDIKYHASTGDIYIACDGGLHRLVAATNTWEILHYNLPIALQYALAISPNGNTILVGNQDVQTFKYDRISNSWAYANNTLDDGQQPAFSHLSNSICYASEQSANRIFRSTDGGNNFTTLPFPTEMQNEYGKFDFTALQIHPSDISTLFVGKTEVWKTTNAGVSWSKISSFNPPGTVFNPIWCMKVAPSNPNIIYASSNSDGKLHKTINGGTTWTVCTHPSDPHSTYSFESIEVHNTNPNTIWGITNDVFYNTVWKSIDGGTTWIYYEGNLPRGHKYSIIFQKGTDEGVYIATQDGGVYYRDNTLPDWVAFNTSLPHCLIRDLEIDYAHNKLVAATHGRGLWESPLYFIPAQPSVSLKIKAFLQGAYNASTGLMNDNLRQSAIIPQNEPFSTLTGFTHMGSGGGETATPSVLTSDNGDNTLVDWVFLELRDKDNVSSVKATRSALVQRDGDIVDVDGTSPVTFNIAPDDYYVAIRHRNHLGARTASAVSLPNAVTLDFTTPLTPSLFYGTNSLKDLGGGKLGLYMGNVIQDGFLKYSGAGNDRLPILTRIGGTNITATVNGYFSEDCNMDGVVKYSGSGNDRLPILSNIGGTNITATITEQL
jgi:xyloglucan-specific exo-beta-1,4-glucanase